MRNKIKYSQNFLKNPELVAEIVDLSGISKDDLVLEIGAGEGIITEKLLKKAKKIIAFEIDKFFFDKLSKKFRNNPILTLKNENFLNFPLPTSLYKVFSNIPFNITSEIIKRLTFAKNPPEESYLIVQKEAATKFTGKPLDSKNTQISIVLYPWFEFKVIHKFVANDFIPKPNVDIVLLEIKKREKPLVENRNKYQDFITYAFNQPKPNIAEGLNKIMQIIPTNKRPSELNFEDWALLFEQFLKLPQEKQSIVAGSFTKQQKDQEKIEKIHRTRVDKNWRENRN